MSKVLGKTVDMDQGEQPSKMVAKGWKSVVGGSVFTRRGRLLLLLGVCFVLFIRYESRSVCVRYVHHSANGRCWHPPFPLPWHHSYQMLATLQQDETNHVAGTNDAA